MSVYLVTNGEHAGAWLADDVVKRNAIIAAHDDAYIAAQHDVATGTGADPAPTPEQERYIKAYIEGFVAEFVKLYPKAYATAYKRTYRAAYTAAALERANPLDDRIAETARAGDLVLVMGARDPSLTEFARSILRAIAGVALAPSGTGQPM